MKTAILKALVLKYREHLLVLAAGLTLLGLHAIYRIKGFGELDQARFGRDIVVWHLRGGAALDDFSYRLRTSPLFMRAFKFALDHGRPIHALPYLMNWYAVTMSSACAMALYYLFRKLTSRLIAAAIVITYSLTPGFWLLSLYGMPTVPAQAYLACSALAFAIALEKPLPSRSATAWLVAALVLCWLSFTHKVDVALGASALLSVPLLRRLQSPQRWRSLLVLFGLGGLVVGSATELTLLFTKSLSAHTGAPIADRSTSQFYASWREQYAMSLDNLLTPDNNMPITHSVGTVWFAIVLLATVHGLVTSQQTRARTLSLLAWALPTVLFWGLVAGNSARHNVPAGAAMIALAVLFLFDVSPQPWRAYLLCGLISLVSLLDKTGHGEVVPTFNFLEGARQIQTEADANHLLARRFMRVPGAKKALIDSDHNMPYGSFEVMAAAQEPTLSYDPTTVKDLRGNSVRLVNLDWSTPRVQAVEIASELRKDGFLVCSLQHGFCDGI